MARMVRCSVLGEESEGLERPPYPGPLGQRIFEQVSKAGWQRWIKHQTMLINEHRLSLADAKSRKFLEGEMVRFLFEGGTAPPAGYVPPAR
jgi:Fe-S cluster biosynthesis and repair protein YggX